MPEAITGNESEYFAVLFGHLASLMRAKMIIMIRFHDAVLPDFSRFSADSDDRLNFFTDPRHGRY